MEEMAAAAQPAAPDALAMAEAMGEKQHFFLAVAAGLGAAILSAVLWASVTALSGREFTVIAIAVGFAIGPAIRLAGRGRDYRFGLLGAACAVVGCALGHVLMTIGAIARANAISPLDVMMRFPLSYISKVCFASFRPIDLLFYAIAVYAACRLSFRSQPR